MTAPSALERIVARSLRRGGLSGRNASLLVACSGGPDSTALLRCLHHLRDLHQLRIHVAHLNHDFRGAEADHDAAFVQHLADGLGLPCSIDKQDPIAYQRESGVSSFEQAAREMRYSFLHAVAADAGAVAVALGHTEDDQAETVLLHAIRGSGLHGLRGMTELVAWPWPQHGAGPMLFRPLLDATKAETADYCRALGQSYRQDSGNYIWRFTRNKVRLDLMPRLARDFNPRIREALVRLSRAATEELDFIDGELDKHWTLMARETGDSVMLDVDALRRLHPALQRHAFRRAYAYVTGDARGLAESHLAAGLSLVRNRRGGRVIDLPRGVCVRLEAGIVRVTRTHETPAAPQLAEVRDIHLPRGPGERLEAEAGGWLVSLEVAEEIAEATGGRAWTFVLEDGFSAILDREALGDSVSIRGRQPGDRFHPSGMKGSKKLQDFFADSKVPRSERDGVPLLECERGIAWVVGYRVADWAMAKEGASTVRVSFNRAGRSVE